MRFTLLFIFLINLLFTLAQQGSDVTLKVDKKYKNWDTTRYQKFERVLIVGLLQQHRTFSNELSQSMSTDTLGMSASTYSTEFNFAGSSGITLSYDKFQLALTRRIEPTYNNAGRGSTDMFNIGFNVGDNRWVSENYYRRFKGFYNTKTPSLDSAYFAQTKQYFQYPKMVTSLFMSRFLYFNNYVDYSFKSGFGCNFRQLKSAFTWINGGSISVYNLHNDSAIVPLNSRAYYKDYANFRGLRSINIAYNFGAAATIVLFKAWFLAGYFTLGPEQQWRNYDLITEHRRISYISWSGTGRLSMGLNMKRMYIIWGFTNDYTIYGSRKTATLRANCLTSNFTFGWRFHTKTPAFYEKFMKSKIYSYL